MVDNVKDDDSRLWCDDLCKSDDSDNAVHFVMTKLNSVTVVLIFLCCGCISVH